MCDIFAFADQNIWAVFWLGLVIIINITAMINRLFRTIRVIIRGWPPEHLDIDGDFKTGIADNEYTR